MSEIINLPKFLRSKNGLSKMPWDMSDGDITMVTYRLQQLIRSKPFNQEKYLESFTRLLYSKPKHCTMLL